ncbi:unnamed protein product [Leptidea sinapis]|uniref:Uncharacterized protein n=1 Tax=Leptidea sinapis TaxID=189913 RepID=A0A5E4Q338_9NEOP|nr:unnamed protein product [Leptidea sinapis]
MAHNNVSIFYQNCGGIKSKLDELRHNIALRDRNLSISGKKGGGGILVLVKNSVKAIRLPEFEALDLEEIYIHLPSLSDLLLNACYFPPSTPSTAYSSYFYKLIFIPLRVFITM